MTAPLLIGLATGLVSALLFAQASTGTMLGLFVLFFLSPLPVAIAGLGWGWVAAATAAIVGATAVAIVGTGRAALFHLLTLGAPTALMSYLLLLSRVAGPQPAPDQPPPLEWYPIGRVITWAAAWAGILSVLAVLATASDIATLKTEVRGTIDRMVGAGLPVPGGGPNTKLGEAELATLTDLMVATMPGIIASAWMSIATLNLWLAGLIVRASGRLTRPWPDLPALTLPRIFPLLFGVAVLATFLPGFPGLLASGVASALFFPYVLVGLAILHFVTRGSAIRGPLLAAVYTGLVLFNPVSGLLLALIGIAEPISPLKRRWPQAGAPTT